MNEDPQVVLFCVVAEFLVSYNFRHFEWMEEGDKLRCQLFRNGSALTIFSPTGTQLAVRIGYPTSKSCIQKNYIMSAQLSTRKTKLSRCSSVDQATSLSSTANQ